jgi:hypothetical protein
MVNNSTNGIVDHRPLEAIVHVVDIREIVDHHCLEAIVQVVDIGGPSLVRGDCSCF